MTTRHDPAHYRAMCVPFDDRGPANDAVEAFFADVEAARAKHRIADVVVLCEVVHLVEGEGDEVRGAAMVAFGDSTRVLTMLAREFGAEQVRHQDRIALIVAQGRKGAR